MHNPASVAWIRFEFMMRTGVPHAMDIAAELVRHDLQTPLPTQLPKAHVDLQFYNVVHCAYRAGVLSRFLTVMSLVKQTKAWDEVQNDKDAQLSIVRLCQESGRMSILDATTFIVSFLIESPARLNRVA